MKIIKTGIQCIFQNAIDEMKRWNLTMEYLIHFESIFSEVPNIIYCGLNPLLILQGKDLRHFCDIP